MDGPELRAALVELQRAAPPDLISVLEGEADCSDLPGQVAQVAHHLRGFRIGHWEFDLTGEDMDVDIAIPVNGPRNSYHPVLDTRGDGVFYVDVDPDTGHTGAVLCFTRDFDVVWAGSTLLDFLARAVNAARTAMALVRRDASARPDQPHDDGRFGEYFADDTFFRTSAVVPATAAELVGPDPTLAAITARHPHGFVADLRTATAPVLVPLLHQFDSWPAGEGRISRYQAGSVIVAHPA